jgi:TrmH family RNA methyltransferase
MIERLSNPKVKHLKKLLSSAKYRNQHRCYVIETPNVLRDILNHSPQLISEVYVRSLPTGLSADSRIQAILQQINACRQIPIIALNSHIMDSIATVNSPEFLALIRMKEMPGWDDSGATPKLMVYCDGIQIPANLGAIIRSMVAFNCFHVLMSTATCDVYHPECMRAASGAVSHIAHHRIQFDAVVTQMPHVQYVVLDASEGESLFECNPQFPMILIAGAEKGLSAMVKSQMSNLNRIKIPTSKYVDSLNVAVSVGIALSTLSNRM